MKSINFRLFFRIILAVNFLFLYSCSGAKENIGLIKKSPDEFQVYEKKPLSVPPTFELRPPLDSDVVMEDSDIDNVIFKEEIDEDESLTIGDEVLLISIGDKDSEEDIRKVINNENSISEIEKPLLDKILDFEPVFEVDKKDNIIDAEEEKKRIEDLKSELEEIKNNIKIKEDNKEEVVNKNIEKVEENSTAKKEDEEKSFLDEVFDFDLFSSDEEELESKNQRDKTFWNRKKDNKEEVVNKNIEKVEENSTAKKEDEEKSFLDEVFDFDLFSSDEEELESKNQRDKTFWNRKKDKSVNNNNKVVSSDKKERIDSSKEADKIIDAVISEKEGSID